MSDDKGRRIAGGVGHPKTTRTCLDALGRLFVGDEHRWESERKVRKEGRIIIPNLEEVNWDSPFFSIPNLHHDAMIHTRWLAF